MIKSIVSQIWFDTYDKIILDDACFLHIVYDKTNMDYRVTQKNKIMFNMTQFNITQSSMIRRNMI